MTNILADVFRNMILKRWGADDGFDIIVNSDRGDLEIWRTREIVPDGELDDEVAQIEISLARKIVPDLEIGEELIEEIKIEDFGRRNVLAMRQNLASRIMELEKDHIYQKYKERVGDIIAGEVYQVWKKEILVLDDENNELLLPPFAQWSIRLKCAITLLKSFSAARLLSFWRNYSNKKCLKYLMV
jgi:N utilization substance protein A